MCTEDNAIQTGLPNVGMIVSPMQGNRQGIFGIGSTLPFWKVQTLINIKRDADLIICMGGISVNGKSMVTLESVLSPETLAGTTAFNLFGPTTPTDDDVIEAPEPVNRPASHLVNMVIQPTPFFDKKTFFMAKEYPMHIDCTFRYHDGTYDAVSVPVTVSTVN
jgi:hypothetical protein